MQGHNTYPNDYFKSILIKIFCCLAILLRFYLETGPALVSVVVTALSASPFLCKTVEKRLMKNRQ